MRFRSPFPRDLPPPPLALVLDRSLALSAPGVRDGRCRSPTSTASATSAISTIAPDGAWVAYTVGFADSPRDKDDADVWMSNWAGTEHVRLTAQPRSRIAAALQPRRQVARVPLQPARGDDDKTTGGPGLAPQPPGRRGAPAHQPQGRRLRLPVVARFDAAGRRRRRPRSRGGQDRRRQDAEEADRHRPLQLQAGRRRLPRSTGARTSTSLTVATGAIETLTSGDWDDSLPAWSPDGTRIAFVSGRGSDADRTNDTNVFVVEAKAGARAAGADDLERPRRPGAAGVEPGRRLDRLPPGQRAEALRLQPQHAGGGAGGGRHAEAPHRRRDHRRRLARPGRPTARRSTSSPSNDRARDLARVAGDRRAAGAADDRPARRAQPRSSASDGRVAVIADDGHDGARGPRRRRRRPRQARRRRAS